VKSLAVLVLSVVAGCATIQHIDPVERSTVTQARAAVELRVVCGGDDPLSSRGVGSGVIISDMHVLTAAHVVECPYIPRIYATLSNGVRMWMAVEREDRDADVARLVIHSDQLFHHAVKPPALRPARGAQSYCAEAGYPTRERKCGNAYSSTVMGFESVPGNSGSGVYDELGNLSGIVVRKASTIDGQSLTHIAPIDASWLEGT
jgi:hypothetical protein